jgi:hypothetical protein
MNRIAHFKTVGKTKVAVRSAGQQLQFDFPAGVSISVVHEDVPTKTINFEQEADDGKATE